jgi:CRP-like cAMP-binding protein
MHPSRTAPPLASNHLLAVMPTGVQTLVARRGQLTHFGPGDIIQQAHHRTEAVIFPLSGILSVRAQSEHSDGIEVAMIGREGMAGVFALQGCDRWPMSAIAMSPGEGVSLEAAPLLEHLQRDEAAVLAVAKYAQSLTVQMSQAALACGRRTVAERLARWILMCLDRIDGDTMAITHEALSAALGVRRPGVTVATHELEGIGAIKANRGSVRVTNRAVLENAARGSYGVAEREYRRLFNPDGIPFARSGSPTNGAIALHAAAL